MLHFFIAKVIVPKVFQIDFLRLVSQKTDA